MDYRLNPMKPTQFSYDRSCLVGAFGRGDFEKEQMYMAATGAQPILYSMQEGPSLFGRQHQ